MANTIWGRKGARFAKTLSLLLCAALVFDSADFTSFAEGLDSLSANGEGKKIGSVITAVNPLDADVANQVLFVGDEESRITFPETITAVVEETVAVAPTSTPAVSPTPTTEGGDDNTCYDAGSRGDSRAWRDACGDGWGWCNSESRGKCGAGVE